MKNLIHKTNFKIIDFTSSTPLKDYALISDDLIQEIKSKYYQDGTYLDFDGIEKPNMINLHLVAKVNDSPIEGKLYSNCDSLVYKDRDLTIQQYETDKINNSFNSKNIKLHVPSLDNVLKAGFGDYWIKFNSNKNIIVEELEQTIDENGITIMPYNIYLDIIAESDHVNFDNAIALGLITREVNPTKTLEIII